MANLANVLKLEITRIARRELRVETESLKKAAAHHRTEIAALKKMVAELERQVAKVGKLMAMATPDGAKLDGNGSGEIKIRYSARSMAAQRKRLGLSAENMGKLFGVSGQTIYGWETGGSRPRNGQMAAIAAVRKLGKAEAASIVVSLSG